MTPRKPLYLVDPVAYAAMNRQPTTHPTMWSDLRRLREDLRGAVAQVQRIESEITMIEFTGVLRDFGAAWMALRKAGAGDEALDAVMRAVTPPWQLTPDEFCAELRRRTDVNTDEIEDVIRASYSRVFWGA